MAWPAIIRDMARMRRESHFDPDYRHVEDTSAVLCPGSTFVGEFTSPPRERRFSSRQYERSFTPEQWQAFNTVTMDLA
ncbi:hypothetical protein ACFQZZ_25385 [Nocardia sp. GCM10030253]|uniref:hypothetical protein n=1 Tax=Nocardia sp. GCM10030253 TaxID=3273404 RepID=UPI00363C655F